MGNCLLTVTVLLKSLIITNNLAKYTKSIKKFLFKIQIFASSLPSLYEQSENLFGDFYPNKKNKVDLKTK